MRPVITSKKELADRLLKRFGYDEPIFTSEIIETWKDYSRPRVFQLLRELVDDKILAKEDFGIYYFPTQTSWGKPSVLGRRQIIDKRFIRNGNEIFGYYSGLTLLNGLYLTTQVPNRLEVVSSRASARIREIKIGKSVVVVRKSKVPITSDNVYALMVLQAFTDMRSSLTSEETRGVRLLVERNSISFEDVSRYASYFPKRTLKSILDTGVQNVFA